MAEGSGELEASLEFERMSELVARGRRLLEALRVQDAEDASFSISARDVAELLATQAQFEVSIARAHAHVARVGQTLEETSRSAGLDGLTGLPNRDTWLKRCTRAIKDARFRGTRLAVLFLDLNNFKQLNDTMGHGIGDQALIVAAQRLSSVVRASDLVSRHGGDEFLVLLDGVSEAWDAVTVADKVIAALGVPVKINEHVVRLPVSVGISLYPDDAEDPKALIELADAAMYRAKRLGIGRQLADSGHVAAPVTTNPLLSLLNRRLRRKDRRKAGLETNTTSQLKDLNERLVEAALHAQDRRTQCEQEQRRQTDFFARIAYELRNALMPLHNAATLLDSAHNAPKMLKRVQGVVGRQVGHMSRLVDDLLDTGRLATGKLSLEYEQVDMVDIVAIAADCCRSPVESRSQHLDVRLPSSEVLVTGDGLRLIQVMNALIDNLSSHTPEGGRIRISMQSRGDKMEVRAITDVTGTGLNMSTPLLRQFAQEEGDLRFNWDSPGIQMALASELVNSHGGDLHVNSGGTGQSGQFTMMLPLRKTLGHTAVVIPNHARSRA